MSSHYNGTNSYLFVNGTEIIKFKAKDPETVATPLFLGKSSKDFAADNMKKTGLNGYVSDFSVDYDAITVANILDIHIFAAMTFFSCNVLNVNSRKCVSMGN